MKTLYALSRVGDGRWRRALNESDMHLMSNKGKKSQKRGWDSITIDILAAALQPEKKMRIMYKANLNFDRFYRYFCDLQEKGFIEKIEDGNGQAFYRTSQRGKTLLAACRKSQDLMDSNNI